ncbi:MAG: hypothetical protein ACRDS0_37800 [Pseudonocardiaceae bacterium]
MAALTAGAAIGVAPAAGAYPGDVPGMVENATQGYACDNWERFTFGHGPNGQALTCHFIPNQYPDPLRGTDPGSGGYWMISYPLYGVQEIGSPCPNPQSAAQAPDGLPLLCVGAQGWQPGIFTGGAGPYAPPGIVPYPLGPPQPHVPVEGHL